MNPEQIKFIELLSELYPDSSSRKTFLSFVGFDKNKIDFEGNARNAWTNILSEAINQEKVGKMYLQAVKDYTENSELTGISIDRLIERRNLLLASTVGQSKTRHNSIIRKWLLLIALPMVIGLAGYYIPKTMSKSGNSFTIKSVKVKGEEQEPNDDFSTPNQLHFNKPISGEIVSPKDSDKYLFEISERGDTEIKLENLTETLSLLMYLKDFDKNLITSTYRDKGVNLTITEVLEPGKFYVVVQREELFSDAERGKYILRISHSPN